MRKVLRITSLLIFVIIGCTTIEVPTEKHARDRGYLVKTWLEYEVPPSKIDFSGKSFAEVKLSKDTIVSIFYENIGSNAEYYYGLLMQDLGWERNEDKWYGHRDKVRKIKRGYIYLNPTRCIAIYFYPEKGYEVFKAKTIDN
jgi:hypothetical protein